MDQDYHTAQTDQMVRRLTAIMFVDAVFSCLILFWSEQTALLLVDPIRWATWTAMSPRPDLFEYPFILVWGLPIMAVGTAYVLRTSGALRAATWVATFPLLYLGTLIGCYHLLPILSAS